jgi:glucose-6-phosphate 1-dehydrogenase
MTDSAQIFGAATMGQTAARPSEPCVMLIFGASGDLTKRLLLPAIYNLACDGLLAENFVILGSAISDLSTEQFRANISSSEDGIRKFHTRGEFDADVWEKLVDRIFYQKSSFESVEDFKALRRKVAELETDYQTHNILIYFATAPSFFGLICENLFHAGFREGKGWRRIIAEKPFGTDTESARALNAAVLKYWDENQIYRVDHYLGKETVQNLLAFRFANGMFEPLWNKHNIDNIQFNVCEEVDVGARGGYYDKSGVLRDMMQNHMFQMLAYLCMEPPASFEPDAIRNEKSKLLSSVRVYKPEEVPDNFVRGQYGASFDDEGEMLQPGYRYAQDVNPLSNTETFAAGKLYIDNWRWEGVPIYLRSGKALWKRGTEIVVEFKKAPEAIFRGTSVKNLAPNRLVFHIQPYQGIELLFQAKVPGPTLTLQKVDMRFSYSNAFKASRYTGYEVMIYSCTHGDATLFSRGDLVEEAWKIAQPILDYWKSTPANDFPNYVRGSWGPKAASALIAKDGRHWFEIVTPDVLERSPLFKGSDPILLNSIIMALRSESAEAGEIIIQKGDIANEMYLICSGEVAVLDSAGEEIKILKDGDFFGEIGLLISSPRTATIRANMLTDLFVLDKADFNRILRESPHFSESMLKIAKERYDVTLLIDQLTQ